MSEAKDWIVVDIKRGLEDKIPKDKYPDEISTRNERKVYVSIHGFTLCSDDYSIQIAG
jgi:hypothetical protein